MFESRISAGAKEKLPTRDSGKPDAETTSSWCYDMEGAKKCVERYCEFANKTTQQSYEQWENCPQFAHTLFRSVCIWHVLVDLMLYGL